MRKTFLIHAVAAAMVSAFISETIYAQGVIERLKPEMFKKVEADPRKAYALTETEGPYLIFVTSFFGPTAPQDAHSLVLELRKSFKWHAYVFEKTFEHDASKDFGHMRSSGPRAKPKYLNPGRGTEYAVVIGNFPSLEDRQFKKTLEDVRKCQPSSLKNKAPGTTYSLSFGLANPLLAQVGTVDPFVKSFNEERPFSLLRNPYRYTVQIATFTPRAYMKPDEIKAIEEGKRSFSNRQVSDLEMGEQAAAKLCQTLRKQGVEAYEFHDRYSSIVTVGGFDQHTPLMLDGRGSTNPQVQRTIERFQARMSGASFNPVIVAGIPCDAEPKVVEVPRVRR